VEKKYQERKKPGGLPARLPPSRLRTDQEDTQPAGTSLEHTSVVRDSAAAVGKSKALTPARRRKQQKDRARNRVPLDMDPGLEKALQLIIQRHQEAERDIDGRQPFSLAGLVQLLVIVGLKEFLSGGLDVREWLEPSYSPRFSHTIRLPDIPDVRKYKPHED
jgi:hypothetical protein